MDVCKGMPSDSEQGYAKPCPIRFKCWRHRHYIRPPAGADTMTGPYDFEDEECSKFVEDK